MKLSDFHYDLPEHLIAQQPPEHRAGARMLVIHRDEGRWEDRKFSEFPEFVKPGDCVAMNNSRVIPSRLIGNRPGRTGRIEVFLTEAVSDDRRIWKALVKPGRKLGVGDRVEFSPAFSIEILDRGEHGERTIRLDCEDVDAALEASGHVPLPPYIHRADTVNDKERYQTVFAKDPGSVAAPTAGLHFTRELLDACKARGAQTAQVTLHVGLGTFQPIREEQIEANHLHQERFHIAAEDWARIDGAQKVIAIGTTSVRTIETAAGTGTLSGTTDIFIYPGYEFRRVNALLTNFHLPQSSLLLLVCAFGGQELMLDAYRHAVREQYRFFSYGDCMLIL